MNLQDAIGDNTYLIENEQYTDTDFQNMPTDELDRMKMRISLRIESLSAAIKAKQIDFNNGERGSTKEWFISHRHVLTINQRMLPYINSIIRWRRRSLSDHFMDQARLLLPKNDFEDILMHARIIQEGKH